MTSAQFLIVSKVKKSRNGSFTTVLAHRDPGVDNWLDTQGNATVLFSGVFYCPKGHSTDNH